jgi:hypothetical protein
VGQSQQPQAPSDVYAAADQARAYPCNAECRTAAPERFAVVRCPEALPASTAENGIGAHHRAEGITRTAASGGAQGPRLGPQCGIGRGSGPIGTRPLPWAKRSSHKRRRTSIRLPAWRQSVPAKPNAPLVPARGSRGTAAPERFAVVRCPEAVCARRRIKSHGPGDRAGVSRRRYVARPASLASATSSPFSMW